jgi:hypothetical protein
MPSNTDMQATKTTKPTTHSDHETNPETAYPQNPRKMTADMAFGKSAD